VTRRSSAKRFLACCALTLGLVAVAHGAASRPNILVIVVDDLGYGELGCQGNREIPTPHIDSIAINGIRFTDGHVTAPVCSPSRAGLLTGRYQTRFGHELNAIGRQNLQPEIGLPLSEVTLADALKAAGYATGLIGKWHLGGTPGYHPQKRGFDEVYGFLHEGHFYLPPPYRGATSFLRIRELPSEFLGRKVDGEIIWSTHLPADEPPYDADNPILRGGQAVIETEYLTDALTREAKAFIERHKDHPFFLYLAYNAPHSPMQAAGKYLSRFGHIENLHRRVFAAMLANLDEGVGAVLEQLNELKLDRDTIVFFLSDNGGPTAELTSSNTPLRGGKGQLWEGGIRVPFLMQWKGRLSGAQVFRKPIISLDVFGTVMAAAGRDVSGHASLDGVDLLPYLTGQRTDSPHEVLFWRYGRNMALRRGNWKLVRQFDRDGRSATFELFNLADDVAESRNLAQQRPDLARELRAAAERLNRQMVEPRWGSGK
jgi:arylsulfatase A-like enzyme